MGISASKKTLKADKQSVQYIVSKFELSRFKKIYQDQLCRERRVINVLACRLENSVRRSEV